MNISINGVENKETIVFIHDIANNQNLFNLEYEKLSKKYRVIKYDLIGHGSDRGIKVSMTIDLLSEQLEKVFNTTDTSKAHLISFGFGHYIAIDFAKKHPHKVLSLNTVNGLGHYKEAKYFQKLKVLSKKSISDVAWRREYNQIIYPNIKEYNQHTVDFKKISDSMHIDVLKEHVSEIIDYDIEPFLKETKIPILWILGNKNEDYIDTLSFLSHNHHILISYLPDTAHLLEINSRKLFLYFIESSLE